MRIDGFDWDEGNLAKCQKHGVLIEEIETLFRGFFHVAPDGKHSAAEQRQLAVGRSIAGRPMFVAFTIRLRDGRALVRPISARCTPRKLSAMSRQVPHFKSDEEAEAFLEQDLSDLDFTQFKPTKFEFSPKAAQLNMRLPEALLDAVKTKAKEQGIPYTRYIRQLLEHDISRR